jgi:hypothetical protein
MHLPQHAERKVIPHACLTKRISHLSLSRPIQKSKYTYKYWFKIICFDILDSVLYINLSSRRNNQKYLNSNAPQEVDYFILTSPWYYDYEVDILDTHFKTLISKDSHDFINKEFKCFMEQEANFNFFLVDIMNFELRYEILKCLENTLW